MNPASVAFALLIAALVGAAAWFIDWGAARSGHWGKRKRSVVRRLMVGFMIVTAVFVYWTDSKMRGITLFEVVGPWEENGGRIWIVEVEHPGIEHELMVYPFARGLESVARPVTLRVLFGESGETAHVDVTTEHELVPKSGRNATDYTWRETKFHFTPTRFGPHELVVESVDGIVPPLLHLRVTDPEKRDGKRAPGY